MFFKTKGTIPDGYGFSAFDPTHVAWLAAALAVIVAMALVYRRLGQRRRRVMCITVGAVIVLQETLKNVIVAAVDEFTVGYLPFHLCGINIILIGFDIFKQTKTVRNFLYYIGIPGALLALLFPNWTSMPFFNFFHLHSFIIHILLVAYPVMLISGGDAKPTVRDMPKCILLLVGFAIPVYIINLVCDTNFMFLMSPDKGNPLELFEKLLGNHLFGFPILLPIVMLAMYLPLFCLRRLKRGKRSDKTHDAN